jgi:penicillin amidase
VRALRRILAALLLIVLGFLLAAYLALRASLPRIDGEHGVVGLSAAASIERDALGVPTIRASNRRDLAWATGYAHGQDRYFQMDLSRRLAAGELSELVGPAALDTDKRLRIHRFRHVAQQVLQRASAEERALLESYAQGVNAGLESLVSRPFEYWVLRTRPAPWRAEDCILAVFAMYEQLNYEGFETESSRGRVHDALPEPLYSFIYARGTEWDAPLEGAPLGIEPIPSPEQVNIRDETLPWEQLSASLSSREEVVYGSNNWAVAGSHTRTGVALFANDMHLGLAVPNVWYRARLQVADPSAAASIDVNGVTLPGGPGIVAGSNGDVAWGFTNSQGDWTDLIVLREDPSQPGYYATPEGPRAFNVAREVIRVKGRSDETLEVLMTTWGPVFDRDNAGRRRAAAWIAHEPLATNFGLLGLESARTVEQALDVANRSGIPPQNFVAVDSEGNIGWTIMGRIPVREAFDSRVPADWSQPATGWKGFLEPERYPRIVNPAVGRIWTANARVVDAEALGLLGDGDLYLGARAQQIRDGLLALDVADESDMLAIHLDDRALFLERWRDKLLAVLDAGAVAEVPRRAEFRRLLESWGGRAAVDSVGYRLVRTWRSQMHAVVFGILTFDARRVDADAPPLEIPAQFEGPLWQLMVTEPEHLLPANVRSWRELELGVVDQVIARLDQECGSLPSCTWGKRNSVSMRHPLSRAMPVLGALLDMPRTQQPGDAHMPRVQTATFGASERFAVSPGLEAQGYFHMPGGQSGHPLSPFYRAGHDAWAEGRPLSFLPGPAEHRLTFTPGGR